MAQNVIFTYMKDTVVLRCVMGTQLKQKYDLVIEFCNLTGFKFLEKYVQLIFLNCILVKTGFRCIIDTQ